MNEFPSQISPRIFFISAASFKFSLIWKVSFLGDDMDYSAKT